MKISRNYSKYFIPLTIFLVTYIIRSYRIESGSFVTWDEAHFGKFSEKYLTRTFYFDVHPPLGKMLTAFSGWLFGQPIGFNFDSGSSYPNDFDYTGMRRFHAFIASFTPLFSFLILKEIGYSLRKRCLLSLLFIFENGFTSIGRLILLDSHLLSCTSAVAYAMARLYFRSYKNIDLLLLGFFIGLVLSIKWIGCITMAFVGVLIIHNLWNILNSKKNSLIYFLTIFAKNAIFLILLPVTIYVALFYVHFLIVNKSGPDDGHMSSFFQASLQGSNNIKNRKYVAFGTSVTVKSSSQGGGYLHSHDHSYPDFSENQITSYSHKDNNNNWVFQKVTDLKEDATFIYDGDLVVLYHLETARYLSMSGRTAYLSEGTFASATKTPLRQDNVFEIKFIEDTISNENKLKSLTTKFLLKSQFTGEYLTRTDKNYPSWGFSQGEVIGSKQISEGSHWNVEENISTKFDISLNPIYEDIYKYAFLKNFIEHNAVMYRTNKSFVQDTDLEPDRIVSKPYEWVLLKRGLRMCSWDEKSLKFYMFGNPLIWYVALLCTVLSPFIFLTKVITNLRKKRAMKFVKRDGFEVFLSFGGWLFHYIPFFFVGRVLYFHHYYPALFFSIFSICYVFRNLKMLYLKSFVSASILTYILYSKITYGFTESNTLLPLKLISSWDFVD